MQEWFEIKVRAVLGPDNKDDKGVVILGRTVTWRLGEQIGKQMRSTGSC